jgi:hypothetical protein
MDTFLLDAGNVFLFASGFLMLYTAYKDRKVLRGYNLSGTVLIVLAISLFLCYYAQQSYWLSFILTTPNYGYWVIVCVSILRNKTGVINSKPA